MKAILVQAEYDFSGITGDISDSQLYDLCRKPAAGYSIRSCISFCQKVITPSLIKFSTKKISSGKNGPHYLRTS